MPKVLRIINRLNVGGPVLNAAYLTKYMPPEYETMLAAGMMGDTEGDASFVTDKMGIEPVYIQDMERSISPAKDWKAYQQIKALIKSFQPDIVHTHAAKPGTLGRLAAIHSNVPVILHTFHGHVFHSYFSPLKTRLFLGIERYLARRSSAIIAISELQKKELVEDFKICEANKMRIVPLGFDLQKFSENQSEKRQAFRSKYQLKDHEIAIGIVGRLVPVKNHSLFLRSLRQVLDQSQHSIRAFIIGDGESKTEIMAEAGQLDIPFTESTSEPAALTFTSWIRDIDVAYAGLDLVALSSFNEGTPVSLIEAQASSRPIVSTRVGGVADIVATNETALLAESDDDQAFAKHLLTLTENANLRSSMSRASADLVMKKFSYTRLVSDMHQLYQELLARA